MLTIQAREGQDLPLGRQGENYARRVTFDFSAWADAYGFGIPRLLVQRPSDSAPYPVTLSAETDSEHGQAHAFWDVSATDTEHAGTGRAELRYYSGETLVKSAVFHTSVTPSLATPETAPPTPGSSWADGILDAASRAERAAMDAALATANIDNVQVRAVTLEPGSPASVSAVSENGVRTMTFSIPAGTPGRDGTDGTNGINGTDGTNGTDGADGVSVTGIETVSATTLSGGENTYRLVLSNGEKLPFSVRNGAKGDKGDPFTIAASYASYNAMTADFSNANIPEGSFVVISSNPEDPHNAELYHKGGAAWELVTDLSGAQGLTGPAGNGIDYVEENTNSAGDTLVTLHFTDSNVQPFPFTVHRGLPGQNGANGAKGEKGDKGDDATINGEPAIEIEAGENITLTLDGTTLTISSDDAINTVKVNGTALSIVQKAVDILIASGAADGAISVNGADVAVTGLAAALTALATLIGTDTNKSVRSIALEELAAQLIPEDAQAAMDTLQEIAAWIQRHPDNAAAINAKLTLGTHEADGQQVQYATVKAYVEAMVTGLITLASLSASVTGAGNAITGVSYDNTTGEFAFTKGTTFLTQHQDISGKVDKVSGKVLSANDFTNELKAKLDGIPSDATNNAGTITGITMNGVSKGTSGVVNLGTVLTQHQDISGKQDKLPVTGAANKGVYISAAGVVSPMTYELNKNVPANAVFTDTTYSPAVSGGANGLMTGADKAKLDSVSMPVILANQDVATFTSAAGRPLRVTVNIEPQQAAGTPSPSNPLPISGVSSITVTHTGKNFYPIKNAVKTNGGVTFTTQDGVITINGTFSGNTWVNSNAISGRPDFKLSPGTYAVSLRLVSGSITGNGAITFGDPSLDWGYLSSIKADNPAVTKIFTLTQEKRSPMSEYLGITPGVTYTNVKIQLQLERFDAVTDFESIQYNDTTFALLSSVETVYGGTLDVARGLLTVTHGQYASYSGQTLPGAWISSKDVYTPGGTPTTGAQVVYELASPITYQLTPQQIITLDGTNNILANCGPVTVTHWPGTGTPVEPVEDAAEIAWKKGILDRFAALEGGN